MDPKHLKNLPAWNPDKDNTAEAFDEFVHRLSSLVATHNYQPVDTQLPKVNLGAGLIYLADKAAGTATRYNQTLDDHTGQIDELFDFDVDPVQELLERFREKKEVLMERMGLKSYEKAQLAPALWSDYDCEDNEDPVAAQAEGEASPIGVTTRSGPTNNKENPSSTERPTQTQNEAVTTANKLLELWLRERTAWCRGHPLETVLLSRDTLLEPETYRDLTVREREADRHCNRHAYDLI